MSRSTRSTPPGWRGSPSAPMSRKAPLRGHCSPSRSRKPIPKHVISSRCSMDPGRLRTRNAEPRARPRRRDDRPGRALSLGQGQAQRPRGQRPRPHDHHAQPSGRHQAARPALTSHPRAVPPGRPATRGTLGADAGHPRPWRWMLIIYNDEEPDDVVLIVAFQDARSSAAATAPSSFLRPRRAFRGRRLHRPRTLRLLRAACPDDGSCPARGTRPVRYSISALRALHLSGGGERDKLDVVVVAVGGPNKL